MCRWDRDAALHTGAISPGAKTLDSIAIASFTCSIQRRTMQGSVLLG